MYLHTSHEDSILCKQLYVHPVLHIQNQCGSCWEFSTTGALDSAWALSTSSHASLNERQFVDCDSTCSDCQIHVVLVAGIFNLDAPLQVNNPTTVILGLGMVTPVSFPGKRPHGQRLRFCQQERDLHCDQLHLHWDQGYVLIFELHCGTCVRKCHRFQ